MPHDPAPPSDPDPNGASTVQELIDISPKRRFSPSDYLELAAVFSGPHPETGEELTIDDTMSEGVRESAGMPKEPTGVVGN